MEDGNPHVIWSASEDGTLRQHDLREGIACPPHGSPPHDCRNVLVGIQPYSLLCYGLRVASVGGLPRLLTSQGPSACEEHVASVGYFVNWVQR